MEKKKKTKVIAGIVVLAVLILAVLCVNVYLKEKQNTQNTKYTEAQEEKKQLEEKKKALKEKQAEAVNEEAYERLDNIEAAWLKKHMTGKKKTFMEQLYLRNQARAMAEEIVINEIVFKCR